MNDDYCEKHVKTYDADRYMIGLTYRPCVRRQLWPLFAFYHEISKTRDVVSETQMGQIRLQWWRDSLADLYASEPDDDKQKAKAFEHPVLSALYPLIRARGLLYDDFASMIYAREFDLEDVPPDSFEGLVQYADYTHTPLMHMLSRIVQYADMDQQCAEKSVRDVAVLYSLVQLIRSVPRHIAGRRCYLPSTFMGDAQTSQWALYNGKDHDKVGGIIARLVSLMEEQGVLKQPKGPGALVLMPWYRFSVMHLKALSKRKYNPFDVGVAHGPRFQFLRLLWG